MRPEREAPRPPGQGDDDDQSSKKQKKTKKASGKLRAKSEALQRKRRSLAKKWGKLAKKFSKRDLKADGAAKQKAMCQLCSQQKIAVRVQFAATEIDANGATAPPQQLMLCRSCVLVCRLIVAIIFRLLNSRFLCR